jgi:hypothetical protein
VETSRLLRSHLETAALVLRVPWMGFVRSRGINDFLREVSEKHQSSRDLAATALEQLSVGDTPEDGVLCVGIIRFLDETVDDPSTDPTLERRCRDLKNLMDSRASCAQYREWVQSWYP